MDALRVLRSHPLGASHRMDDRRSVSVRHGRRRVAGRAGAARPGPVLAAAPRGPAAGRGDPAAVPARAVSVPVLPFLDGKEIRVGETRTSSPPRLGRAAESGRQEIDRGTLGERLTRFYEYAGSRFILVFEPFERNGEPGSPRSICLELIVRLGAGEG